MIYSENNIEISTFYSVLVFLFNLNVFFLWLSKKLPYADPRTDQTVPLMCESLVGPALQKPLKAARGLRAQQEQPR